MKTPAEEAAEALDAAYAALAASENDEDRAFHAAMRAGRGRPSAAISAALYASRVMNGETSDALFRERFRESRERNRRLLEAMEAGGELDHAALNQMSADGHRANELIATYYENLTDEDWDRELANSKEVAILPVPGGPRVAYGVTFSREDIAAIRKAIGGDADMFEFMHDAIMAHAAQLGSPEG